MCAIEERILLLFINNADIKDGQYKLTIIDRKLNDA